MYSEQNKSILILNWRYVGHPLAGGAEYWTQRVAEELELIGHSVTVFTARVVGRPQVEDINRVRVVRQGSKFLVYWYAKRFLRNRGSDFDIVIEEVNTRPFFAERHIEVPVLSMFHQLADDVWKYEVPFPFSVIGRCFLEPRWLKRYTHTKVLVLSDSTAKSLARHHIESLQVIPPGVESPAKLCRSKFSEPTVCFLARLVPSKRPFDVAKAVQIAQRTIPNLHLIVIGDGRLRKKLLKFDLQNLTVVGHVDQKTKDEILCRSHVLVATSVREGWGMNVTEASVCGTPSIGYDVPGLRDSISSTGGILVEESVEKLAVAISNFFSNPKAIALRPYDRTWQDVARDFDTLIRLKTE